MAEPKKPENTDEKHGGVDILTELGVTGLRHQLGKITEEWLPALQWDNQIKTFIEMKDTPVFGVALLIMETLIRKTPLTVGPPEGRANAAAAVQCAELLDGALRDMDHTFQEHWSEALTCLWAGHSPFDIVWKRRLGMDPGLDEDGNPLPTSKFNDGKLGIRKLSIRSQDTIDRWEFDSSGNYVGFWQVDPNGYETTFIPIKKCLHYRIRAHKNNPQGNSLLRIAYVPYTFAKKFMVIEGVGFERNAYGIPIFYFPLRYLLSNATSDEKRLVEQLYSQGRGLRRDVQELIVAPSPEDEKGKTGFGVDSFKGGGSERNMGIRQAIRDYQKDMAMALVCEMMMLGLEKTGTQSAADSKKDTLGMTLEAIMDGMLDTFNATICNKFALLNGFSLEDAPVLTRGKIVTPSLTELQAYFKPLIDAGAITADEGLEAFFRTAGGAPPKDVSGEPAIG